VLEGLAAEGIRFTRAYSTAPWTKPAVASLFTGLAPAEHGVLSHLDKHGQGAGIIETDVLAPDLVTLAEDFQSAGYETGAIISNPWLVRPYGFDQGFDDFEDGLAQWHASAMDVTLGASLWLAERSAERPWFLYVHYLDPHRPYGPLEEDDLPGLRRAAAADQRAVEDGALQAIRGQTRLADGRSVLALGFEPRLALLERAYEKGIERFDAALGKLLEAVEARGDAGRTAVLVTSDHGESLYERGIGNHGEVLYDEEVAVPLVARLPGAQPQPAVDDCTTSLADVAGLLCRYAGLDCASGRALEPDAGPAALLGGVTMAPHLRGVVQGRYKLLWNAAARARTADVRLFDLERDPGERRNLAAERPEVVGRLRTLIEESEARARRDAPKVELRTQDRERLHQLGYGS